MKKLMLSLMIALFAFAGQASETSAAEFSVKRGFPGNRGNFFQKRPNKRFNGFPRKRIRRGIGHFPRKGHFHILPVQDFGRRGKFRRF